MASFVQRYLDPAKQISEILFGVIGCNIVWGIIDGLLYVFNAMYDRGAPLRATTLPR